MDSSTFHVSREVRRAKDEGRAIVALESTIITHGMPAPTNLEMALDVEDIIREHGAVPATTAILEGEIHFGMEPAELESLSRMKGIRKATERDLPFLLARGASAGTTVGASLAIATSYGVEVFVTGGIGGVAKDAATTWDISADLQALSRYSSILVCSGTKAFMDIGATLEYMETRSIGVVGYRTEEFPFFYSASSGFGLDWTVQDPEEVVAIFQTQREVAGDRVLLLGVPVPVDKEMPYQATIAAIENGLAMAKDQGFKGKALTPFVLEEIKNSSSGKSLEANLALIRNNAKVGAEIAVCLAENS